MCRFPARRSSGPLGTVQLASWGFQHGARCLALHKFISNEMIVQDDPCLLTTNHAGVRSRPSSASVGTLQVVAQMWARGRRQCVHSIQARSLTHTLIDSLPVC